LVVDLGQLDVGGLALGDELGEHALRLTEVHRVGEK
jgi:hypothetical protein